jgi:hypothetical protein
MNKILAKKAKIMQKYNQVSNFLKSLLKVLKQANTAKNFLPMFSQDNLESVDE